MSRGHDKLIGKFKMVVGDGIHVHSNGIEKELVRFGMDRDQNG